MASVEQLIRWMTEFKDQIFTQRTNLTDLDSEIGDGDHGTNMARGTTAVVEKLQAEKPEFADDFGKLVGMALISSVGGASGPLFGTFFLRFGSAAGHVTSLDDAQFAAALEAGLGGVIERGKAQLGDKTMVDALEPAVRAYATGGIAAAVEAAWQGRDATEPMVARKGRASYLGDRSVGHIDPGAWSVSLLFRALNLALHAS
jgi:phosphoenolpyruvate---glycerone phosphotransferase subunit DhaL